MKNITYFVKVVHLVDEEVEIYHKFHLHLSDREALLGSSNFDCEVMEMLKKSVVNV